MNHYDPFELYHHGVQGQRWGIRRFQPYPKGYHGSGRYMGNRNGGGQESSIPVQSKKRSIPARIKDAIVNRKEKKSKKIAKIEERAREARAANKQRVINSGSAAEVLEYAVRGEMTNDELRQISTRLQLTDSISGYAKKDIVTTEQKIDKISKSLKTTATLVNGGIDVYNALAAIYNTTEEGQKKPMRMVSKGQKPK